MWRRPWCSPSLVRRSWHGRIRRAMAMWIWGGGWMVRRPTARSCPPGSCGLKPGRAPWLFTAVRGDLRARADAAGLDYGCLRAPALLGEPRLVEFADPWTDLLADLLADVLGEPGCADFADTLTVLFSGGLLYLVTDSGGRRRAEDSCRRPHRQDPRVRWGAAGSTSRQTLSLRSSQRSAPASSSSSASSLERR